MAQVIKADKLTGAKAQRLVAMRLTELADEARSVVLDARRQAASIISGAKEQAEFLQLQAQEKAHAEGYQRGLEDGSAEGERRAHETIRQQLEAEAAELTRLARSIVEELSASAEIQRRRTAGQVVELSVALAERIVGRISAVDATVATENLGKALELAAGSRRICIRSHPDQVESLRLHCGEFTGFIDGCEKLELIGDATISPGGVKLMIGEGEIDATIETQLARMAEAIAPGVRSGLSGQITKMTKMEKTTKATISLPGEC